MSDVFKRTLDILKVPSIYDSSAFLNALHANVLAMIKYFADNYFNGDLKRVIYASNAYAFRRRVEMNAEQKTQGLNFPFMNLRIANVTPDTSRPWDNVAAATHGIPLGDPPLKVKVLPVTISFEGTMFFSSEIDAQLIQSTLLWDEKLETKLKPSVELTYQNVSHDLDILSVLDFIPTLDAQFDENAWLRENKVRAISLDDLRVQTMLPSLVTPNKLNERYALTKKFILEVFGDFNEDDGFTKLLLTKNFLNAP